MPTAQPFGDIFLVNTPSLDRTAALLYQEQKQRQAKAQQENAAADAQMQKEFANIKSADIPEAIDAWGKYKNSKKQLLFDKTLQQDPKKYALAQQNTNEALANTLGIINGSKEEKERLKGLIAAHGTHPDNFVDNFGELIDASQNTPTSKLKTHKLGDLSNSDTYAYKGSNTDFQKIGTAAAGQPKAVFQSETGVDKNGLQTKITPFLYPNSPAQYFQSYMGALSQRGAGRDAAYAYDKLTKDQIDYINKQYAEITPERWEKMTGSSKPQELVPTNPDNKAEKFAILQAKLHGISNEPKEGAPVFRTNEAKKMQMETARMQQMESIRHANAKDLIDYKKKIDPNDTQLNDTWANTYRDKVFDEAKSSPLEVVTEKTQSGKKVYGHRVPLNKVIVDALTVGKDVPDRVYVTDDGKLFPIYYHYDDKGKPLQTAKGPAVNEDLSRPISDVQFAVNLGAKNATGKAKTKEIRAALSGGSKPTTKPKNDPLGLF